MAKKSQLPGICYLAGSGPGDLGLMTLRCRELIETVDVIIYDYLCPKEALRWAKPGTEVIYAGKKAGDHHKPQQETNALLIEKCRAGHNVLRLKGGDPFVFGRGGEEAQELRAAGIPFEIIPGITSGIAGPAYAGIPVTHRSHNTQLTFFTGHEDPTKEESSLDYKSIARAPGTKVMFMGVGQLEEISQNLQKEGADPDLPVALVRWATTGQQRTISGTLANIASKATAAQFKAPAICVIGSVVNLRSELNWFESRPLSSQRIVVTRTRHQAGDLSRRLAAYGADVFELPTIRIEPPQDRLGFGRLVQACYTYDWIVFTSPNGVDAFFQLFFKLYDDARSLGAAKIACIGPGTAKKVRDFHLGVDLIPKEYVAESLLEALVKENVENQTILWVKAEEARDVLSEGMQRAGAIVDEAIAYRTVAETEDTSGGRKRLEEEGADVITFTSSSTVEHFLALGIPLPAGIKIASIGPITSATLREHNLPVDIEATQHDIPGLVDAIVKAIGS